MRDETTRWPRSVVAVVGAVILVTSCGATSTTALVVTRPAGMTLSPASGGPRPAGAPSARDAVIGYVRALNAHDVEGVRRYLAPEYQQVRAAQLPRFEDWVADIAGARLRPLVPGISPTGLEPQYPDYRDLIEFGATYDIVFHTQLADHEETSGVQTRFFVVGRPRTQDTWLILDIGTGP